MFTGIEGERHGRERKIKLRRHTRTFLLPLKVSKSAAMSQTTTGDLVTVKCACKLL